MPVSLLKEAASIMIVVNLKLYGGEFRDSFFDCKFLEEVPAVQQGKNFEPYYSLLSEP